MPSAAATCKVVTQESDPECYGNVTWAMQTGIYEYPMWYTEYPALSETAKFEDFQAVLAEKVGPSPGLPDGRGWNCPYPCDYEVPTCYDVLPTSPGQCHYNLLWAKGTGITQHPEWYSHFPDLSVNSSLSDFQYALHTKLVHSKVGTGNGTGWQCPMPCTSTYIATSTSAVPVKVLESTPETTTSFTTTSTTTTPVESSSSMPWWCGLLLVLLAGLVVIAIVASRAFLSRKEKRTPKKIKRSLDIEEAEDLFDQIDTNRDGFITREEYNRLSLFDQLDTNHDGVLTREEYNRLSLFDQLDTNRDGVLTQDEYARLAK